MQLSEPEHLMALDVTAPGRIRLLTDFILWSPGTYTFSEPAAPIE
jgi:hypothetical protein